MAQRDDIIRFFDEYLSVARVQDYGPNGLQVSGAPEVRRIAVGVSASLALFEEAAAWGAEMILVHHGLFLFNASPVIGPIMKARLKVLLEKDMTLAGYHLPLDSHPEVGNTVQLLRRLGAEPVGEGFGLYRGLTIGRMGMLPHAMARDDFFHMVNERMETQSVVYPYGREVIRSVGIITGGGASGITEAIDHDYDAYITGEFAEGTQALAREGGMNFAAVGHYNSEKYGVQALAELATEQFAIEWRFIDVPNAA